MIISVFGPEGIVTSTLSRDIFYDKVEIDGNETLVPIDSQGLKHSYVFCGRFALTYKRLNQYTYDNVIIDSFRQLEKTWDEVPHITEFMPYFKKMVVDNHLEIIGVMSAYDTVEDGRKLPFVYQILGEDIRRVNADKNGNTFCHFLLLESETIAGKLIRQTKVRNGDEWEDTIEPRLRCDLYSNEKSIDLCRFLLRTEWYMTNINSACLNASVKADVTIVDESGINQLLVDL